MELRAATSLLVDGPAAVRVLAGKVVVFGCPLEARKTYILRPWRRYPLHALEDSVLETRLGIDSKVEVVDGDTVNRGWVEDVEEVERDDVVTVLGGVDSGKTSYTTLAANTAVKKWGGCVVLSLDPGQTYFTPPTVIGAASAERTVHDLGELKPFWQAPVGTTSAPHGAAAVLRSLEGEEFYSRNRWPVFVDMDGWVEGAAAAAYKATLLKTLKCTKTVIIGGVDKALASAVSEAVDNTVHLQPSSYVRNRGPEDRKKIREWLYRRFIGNLSYRMIPRTWVEHTSLSPHQPDVAKLYGEAESRLVELFGDAAQSLKNRAGLISYLYGVGNTYISLALFCGFERERNMVKVLTSEWVGVRKILVGRVFLTAEGEELFSLD